MSVADVLDGAREHAETMTTDARRRFRTAGRIPGEFRLWRWKAGWTTRPDGAADEVVDLSEGAMLEGVDRLLVAGAVITGQVVEADTRRSPSVPDRPRFRSSINA